MQVEIGVGDALVDVAGHRDDAGVGARLAELQLRILLEEMAARRLRVNVVEQPERVSACFVHGYKKMMVELSEY